MRVQLSTAIVAVAISSAVGLGPAWGQTTPEAQPSQPAAQQQPATQEKKPDYKDRAEYDLIQSILKESDPKKKLDLLNQWKEKYPTTDFREMRLESYLTVYQALKDPNQLLATAKDLLALNPKNVQGLYWVNLLVISMNQTTPDALDLAQKSANGLLTAEKPAAVTDEQWKQTKAQVEILGHRTLGWVAMQRKDYPESEKELTQELKLNPADAEASYWLGSVILAQKKVERQSEALFQFARAAAYDGAGALDAARRKQIEAYVEKAYTTFHGKDPQGFQQLLQLAKANAFPPADFKILSDVEIAEHKQQQLQQSDPSLALWVTLKGTLTADNGAQYFDTQVKNAVIPPANQPALKGTIISGTPEVRPTTLVLGIEKPDTPEVTLKLDAALPGKVEPGRVIEFRGIASAFAPTPFMVTFDTAKKDITGWPAAAAPAKKAPVRKGAARKKG